MHLYFTWKGSQNKRFMKLLELIPYLKDPARIIQIAGEALPGVDPDSIGLYMVEAVGMQSEIKFFDEAMLTMESVMTLDGVQYESFFPLFMAREMVEEFVNAKGGGQLTDEEIATGMLRYWQYDA